MSISASSRRASARRARQAAEMSLQNLSSSRQNRWLLELRWMLFSLLATGLLLAFVSYHAGDPGWSTAGDGQATRNVMGRVGAYFADLLLSLAGVSAYLIPIRIFLWVISDLRRLRSVRQFYCGPRTVFSNTRSLQGWLRLLG